MTIQELHDNIRLMQPDTDGRYFTPENIDSFVHMAVFDMFIQDFKVFEETQRISELLSHFLSKVELPVTGALAAVPGDVAYITSLLCTKIDSTVVQRRVKLLTEQAFADLVSSVAFAPNEDNVAVRRVVASFEVAPASVSEITMTYLRYPTRAKYGYTVSVNGFSFVYNSGTSVQLDFPAGAHVEIMNKALRYMGIPTRQAALVQAESVARAGNQPEVR